MRVVQAASGGRSAFDISALLLSSGSPVGYGAACVTSPASQERHCLAPCAVCVLPVSAVGKAMPRRVLMSALWQAVALFLHAFRQKHIPSETSRYLWLRFERHLLVIFAALSPGVVFRGLVGQCWAHNFESSLPGSHDQIACIRRREQ